MELINPVAIPPPSIPLVFEPLEYFSILLEAKSIVIDTTQHLNNLPTSPVPSSGFAFDTSTLCISWDPGFSEAWLYSTPQGDELGVGLGGGQSGGEGVHKKYCPLLSSLVSHSLITYTTWFNVFYFLKVLLLENGQGRNITAAVVSCHFSRKHLPGTAEGLMHVLSCQVEPPLLFLCWGCSRCLHL